MNEKTSTILNSKEAKDIFSKRGIDEEVYAKFHILILDEINSPGHPINDKIDHINMFIRDNNLSAEKSFEMMLLSAFLLTTASIDAMYIDMLKHFNCMCGQEAFIEAISSLMWMSKYAPLECLDSCEGGKVNTEGCDQDQQYVCEVKKQMMALYLGFFFTVRASAIPIIVAFDIYKDAAIKLTDQWVGLFATYIEMVVELVGIRESIKKSDIHQWHLEAEADEMHVVEERHPDEPRMGAEIIPFPVKKPTVH